MLKPVEERERGLRHPVVDAIAAEPQYLPDTASLTAPLHRWRPRHLKPFMPALRRVAAPPPARPRARRRESEPARRSVTAGPRCRARARSTSRSSSRRSRLADELLDAPDVRHLHAHFAHGTTTVTWHAATIAGLPFSFTGHARDIYAPELNPKGWLRRKLLAARFAVTCTEANVEHLKRIAPEAEVHLVYHGLNADFARMVRDEAPAAGPNGTLRVLGVGRLVAKKGFDVFVDACAELRRRDVPFEALIVGQDDKHGDVVRERIAAHDLGDRVALPGPMGQEELLREYRRAGALAMPCRVLDNDRDGIPNVLVEAMAAGAPVVATGVSGIPELVEHEVNGLLVEPDDPAALATALIRLHEDRELAARVAEAGRRTVRERFDGDRLARRLADLFEEALA